MPLPIAIAEVNASTLTSIAIASTGLKSDARMLFGRNGRMTLVPQ